MTSSEQSGVATATSGGVAGEHAEEPTPPTAVAPAKASGPPVPVSEQRPEQTEEDEDAVVTGQVEVTPVLGKQQTNLHTITDEQREKMRSHMREVHDQTVHALRDKMPDVPIKPPLSHGSS